MATFNESISRFFALTLSSEKIDTELLRCFQQFVFNAEKISENNYIEELIRNLAYDLDFYETDTQKRLEDQSFIGEEKALELVRETFERIKIIEAKGLSVLPEIEIDKLNPI